MTRSPRALLFDVDGTLIDTWRLYLEAYRRAVEPILGYAPSGGEIAARLPPSEFRSLIDWVGEERAEACQDDLCRHYDSLFGSLCEGVYDGVCEMLAHLRSAGLVLGVVTGKGRRAWEITARRLPLGDFAVVVTEDDVAAPKPHPGGLLLAAEVLGVPPAECAYVGDSVADAEAGRRAGMRVAVALWPMTAAGERERFLDLLRPHLPDWMPEHPAELSRLFAPWC